MCNPDRYKNQITFQTERSAMRVSKKEKGASVKKERKYVSRTCANIKPNAYGAMSIWASNINDGKH